MQAKTNVKKPDRIILFEIGIILALLFVNYVMDLPYANHIIIEPPITTIFDDTAYPYTPPLCLPPQDPIVKNPEINKADFFDPTAIIIPITDFINALETSIKPPTLPNIGKISPILISPPDTDTASRQIREWAQVMPQFPGGEQALYQYIASNFSIPERLYDVTDQVELVVQFVVNKNGEVTDVQVIKCSHPNFGTEREAKRLYGKMPKWTPGKNGEHDVAVRLIQPVKLKLYN